MGNASLKAKILLSLLTVGSISMYGFVNTVAAANHTVQKDGEILSDTYTNIFGNGNEFTFNGIASEIYGAGDENENTGDVSGGDIIINGGTVKAVYGGFSKNGYVSQNYITIDNGNITSTVYGGFSSYSNASDNYITINDGTVGAIEGGHAGSNGTANNQHHPHSGWFALRLEAFLPADAKASPQKLPNCTSFTSSPFLGALYFFIYFSNGSTNSFNINWSLSLSSCNCSAIYFFIAFSFLPTVST